MEGLNQLIAANLKDIRRLKALIPELGDSASYNAFDDYIYKNTGKGMVTACIVVHYPV